METDNIGESFTSPNNDVSLPEIENPDSLIEKVDMLQDEFNNVAATDQTEKPKRYRSKKEIAAEQEQTGLQLGFMAAEMLDIVVQRLPNPKPLTEIEKNMFNQTTTRLVKKYFSYTEQWGDEVAFAGCFVVIMVPRLQFLLKKKDEGQNNNNIRKDGNGENNFSDGNK